MRIETIHIVHHSHTDIGFTAAQPVVWDIQQRFIDMAVEFAERDLGRGDDAFRWTCETLAPVVKWLESRPDKEVERFIRLEKAGRIDIAGLFLGWAPLYDRCQLEEAMDMVRRLRRVFGLGIKSAMACDVNGQSWPIVDALLDAGIEGFSMAINTHHGRALRRRPEAFRWAGPSGREILAWNGYPYGYALSCFGIGNGHADLPDVVERRMPQLMRDLAEAGYDLPALMVQGIHPFGDNGAPSRSFSEFAKEWNAAGLSPRIRISTMSQWFEDLAQYRDRIERRNGDWSDFWNFGCASTAFETGVARRSLRRLQDADALAAAAVAAGAATPDLERSMAMHRADAWWSQNVWAEHTWSADNGAEAPDTEDAAGFWSFKAQNAWNAHFLSLLLQRDACSALAETVAAKPDHLLVFNPLPWERIVDCAIPAYSIKGRGHPCDDNPASQTSQDRKLDVDPVDGPPFHGGFPQQYPDSILLPCKVPAFGYASIPISSAVKVRETIRRSAERTVENDAFALRFDACGHLRSWLNKPSGRELIDPSSRLDFASYVHEEVATRDHPWPRATQCRVGDFENVPGMAESPDAVRPDWPALRRPMERMLSHAVERYARRTRIRQEWSAPGVVGTIQRIFTMPDYADWIEVEFRWCNSGDTHPQAQYIGFPFAIRNPAIAMDVCSVPLDPVHDRLGGSCADYFTSGGWIDFSDAGFGVTAANPENPLFMLEGFHFCAMQDERAIGSATLIGWITNNYWTCNYPGSQPGRVRARYRFRTHGAPFDPSEAARFAAEALLPLAPMQYLAHERPPRGTLPDAGSWLLLPEALSPSGGIKTLQVKPAGDGRRILLRLFNTGTCDAEAKIGPGVLPLASVYLADAEGNRIGAPDCEGGLYRFPIAPGRVQHLIVTFVP